MSDKDALAPLVGQAFNLCSVDPLCARFWLDRDCYEAVEDEDDGFRSLLQVVRRVSGHGLPPNRAPLARVTVEYVEAGPVANATAFDAVPAPLRDDFTGYVLRDLDGHVWVLVGTDYYDQCYPCFVFDYNPRRDRFVVPGHTASDF